MRGWFRRRTMWQHSLTLRRMDRLRYTDKSKARDIVLCSSSSLICLPPSTKISVYVLLLSHLFHHIEHSWCIQCPSIFISAVYTSQRAVNWYLWRRIVRWKTTSGLWFHISTSLSSFNQPWHRFPHLSLKTLPHNHSVCLVILNKNDRLPLTPS